MDLRKLRKSLKKEPEVIVLKAQVDYSLSGAANEILLFGQMKGY
jgi:hypothetical protein